MSKTKTKWIEDDAVTAAKLNPDTAGEGIQQEGGGALGLDINGLSPDASPNGAADYVATYDASATGHKKVLLNNLPAGGGGDNISVNGVAANNADFDDTTPAAPANSVNVRWQKDTSAPDNISANVLAAAPAQGIGGGNSQGSASTVSLSDHDHALRTTSGPTDLTIGAVTDGQLLRRSGTALIGVVPNDEILTTQAITNTDTALTDQLNNVPISNAWIQLYLNGVRKRQGAGKDFSVSGQVVTWLAGTGTAPNLKTADLIDVWYLS